MQLSRTLVPMVFLCALVGCKQPSSYKPPRDMGPSHDLGASGHADMGTQHNPDLAECTGVVCEGTCVDTLSDDNNCGSCGNVCQGGATCQSGSCQGGACGGRMVLCEGICTDVSSDRNNCGACGQLCNGTCSNGVCGGGQVTGCNGLIQCVGMCQDGNCANACVANSTPQAQQLLNNIYTCLDQQCPQSNGGICDPNAMGFDMNKCNACVDTATAPNGPCGPAIAACMNDLP